MLIQRIKSIVRRVVRPPLHKPQMKLPYHFLGTEYGGWPLLRSTKNEAQVLSFGIGEDISFDLAAIQKFNCRVVGFDPTPRSREWLAQQKLPHQFSFQPVGISDVDGEVSFYAPAKEEHVSFSISPSSNSAEGHKITAPVLRLESILKKLDLPLCDVLKMDIEGFEYRVIADIIKSHLRPAQILVEFHHGMYGISAHETIAAVESLGKIGYALFYVSSSGREYGFVHAAKLP
jgi:FkbM family methyltransferase